MTTKESPGHVYESVCPNQITPPGQASYQRGHSPFCLCVWALMYLPYVCVCVCASGPNIVFLCTQLYAGAILEVCGWKLGRFPQVQGEFSMRTWLLWYLSSILFWNAAASLSWHWARALCGSVLTNGNISETYPFIITFCSRWSKTPEGPFSNKVLKLLFFLYPLRLE